MTFSIFNSTPTTAVRQRHVVIRLRRLLLVTIVDPTLVQPPHPGAIPSPSYDRSTLSMRPHPSTVDQVPHISAHPLPLQRRTQVGVCRFTHQHGNQRVSIFPFLRCNLPLTLITSFRCSYEGFFSIGLFYRGPSSTFIFASRRHQQGVSNHRR